MKKLNYSNFELVQDIIVDLKINYNETDSQLVEKLGELWKEIIGNTVSKYSKVNCVSEDVLFITCSDSFIANELYIQKAKILEFMDKKVGNLGIKIKDIRFDYKKWKE